METALVYPTPQKTAKPLAEVKKMLDELDLEPIKFKIRATNSPHQNLRDTERRYRQFLYLIVSSGEILIPTTDIDTFWHFHILDTRKYFDDCERIFGFYLHHFPYLGLRGRYDEERFEELGHRTAQIWEATYGEPYRGTREEADFEGCG